MRMDASGVDVEKEVAEDRLRARSVRGGRSVTDKRCTNSLRESAEVLPETDGLNEALNGQEEEFGIDRIHETLRSHADAPPQELLKNMRQAVSDFSGDVPQGDDITLLAIRTSGKSENT